MDQKTRYKAEIDWPDLFKQPWRLFGYSYIYLVVSLVAIGWLYLGNVTTAGKNSVPAAVERDSSASVMDLPLQTPRVIPPVDVMTVGVSTPELVAKGRDLYKANCVSCHGENGLGDGPAGIALKPKPRNFHSLDGWTNGSKVSEIYKTLQEGIVRNNMASYSYLPPLDRFAMAHYVRTFAQGQPSDTPDELKALDAAYALSKGVDVPGQIPISKAMGLAVKESSTKNAAVEQEAQENRNEIFRRVAIDPVRAMTTLRALRGRAATVDDVVKAISEDPLRSGFRADVTRLNTAEWSVLYQAAPAVR